MHENHFEPLNHWTIFHNSVKHYLFTLSSRWWKWYVNVPKEFYSVSKIRNCMVQLAPHLGSVKSPVQIRQFDPKFIKHNMQYEMFIYYLLDLLNQSRLILQSTKLLILLYSGNNYFKIESGSTFRTFSQITVQLSPCRLVHVLVNLTLLRFLMNIH